MPKEIVIDHELDETVKKALLGLRDSEDPVVFRPQPGHVPSRSDWSKFLRQTCGLELDMRHYSFDESIERNDWWEISNQPDKETSYAYSTTPQPFHNDNAWFADPAEVNFFVMEKQAVLGGEQLVYPVSRLINDLEDIDGALFRDLTQTTVIIRKGGGDYQNVTPIITLADGGKVYWNFYRTVKTDPFINDLCDRFFAFLKKQESSSSTYALRCESGDSLAFNDQRLLHARTAFVAPKARDRVLYQSMWRLPAISA